MLNPRVLLTLVFKKMLYDNLRKMAIPFEDRQKKNIYKKPFRGQTLSRPRTGKLEAKAKDQGHKRKCSPKKKVFKKIFRRSQK